MKCLCARPRFWIALLVAILATALAWQTTPWPKATLNSKWSGRMEKWHGFSTVLAMTSDARFVVTRQGDSEEEAANASIAIWDRDADSITPVVEKPRYNFRVLLSPDERVICYVDGAREELVELPTGASTLVAKPRAVRLFELPSGRKVKEFQSSADEFAFDAEGVLRVIDNGAMCDIDSGAEVKRIRDVPEGYKYRRTVSGHALYDATDKQEVRVYSWRTGALAGAAGLAASDKISQVSDDGRVIGFAKLSWNNAGIDEPYPEELVDTVTGDARKLPSVNTLSTFARISPDGETIALLSRVPPRPKLLQWLPQSDRRMSVLRWRTGEELASLPRARELCFAPDGSHVAALRDDHVIEIYDFPFRTPWLALAGIGFLAGAASWSIGWLWTRWRKRPKPQGAAA